MKHFYIPFLFLVLTIVCNGQNSPGFFNENNERVSSTNLRYDIRPIKKSNLKLGSADVGICYIDAPEEEYCGIEVLQPAVWVKNYGKTLVDSFRVMYRLDFFPPVIKYIEESIASGDSVLVNLDVVEVNSGDHSIQVSAYFPNGEEDGNVSNNALSRTFEYINGKQYTIELLTDNYGYETTWQLKNEADQVIASNGDLENATLYETVVCLSPGCYTFYIYDEFGDGICGSYGDGYFTILETVSETEIGTGCDYGEGTTVDFCVEADEGLPIANFGHGALDVCTGEVVFYDYSACNPDATAWEWDFGDGSTSTEQNPTHIYVMDGMYDVSLQVTNANGSHTLEIPNFVEIERIAPPVIADEYFCEQGETIVFEVPEGYEDFNWYTDPYSVTPEFVGNSFTIDNIQLDSTIYYQYDAEEESFYVGLEDNSGDGGYFGFGIDRAIYFDALTDITIKSAKVYASGTADRTITLKNSGGTVLDTRVINIPAGESIINLDFTVSAGVDYAIHVNTSNNLSYTGDYGGPNVGYPFTLPDLISITGNNYSDSFWYFFYDIEVIEGFGESCPSTIAPLSALHADMEYETTVQDVTNIDDPNGAIELTISSGSEPCEIVWSNDATDFSLSDLEAGMYYFTIVDNNGCEFNGSVEVGLSVGLTHYEDERFSIYPNPAKDELYLRSTQSIIDNYEIYDVQGRVMMSSNVSNLDCKIQLNDISRGVYFIKVYYQDRFEIFKFIKE